GIAIERIAIAAARSKAQLVPITFADGLAAGRDVDHLGAAVAAMDDELVARARPAAGEPLQRQPAAHAEGHAMELVDAVRAETEMVAAASAMRTRTFRTGPNPALEKQQRIPTFEHLDVGILRLDMRADSVAA